MVASIVHTFLLNSLDRIKRAQEFKYFGFEYEFRAMNYQQIASKRDVIILYDLNVNRDY